MEFGSIGELGGTGNGEGEVEVRGCGVLQWFTRQVEVGKEEVNKGC